MTKIISGNEIPTKRERLNPKMFSRTRRVQFNGCDLEDNESNSIISLADFKKNITNSFTFSKKLIRFQEVEANCSSHNLILNKQNAYISYFRNGIDRKCPVNTVVDFNITNVEFDNNNYIYFDLEISFLPYKNIIKDNSGNQEINALYSKLCNFHGKELNELEISDNEIRKPEYYKCNRFVLTKSKQDDNIFLGSKSMIVSTTNQRFKYNLNFNFSYNREMDKMSMTLNDFSLVGLYISNTDNVFIGQRPVTVLTETKTYKIDSELAFNHEGNYDPQSFDCSGVNFLHYAQSYLEIGENIGKPKIFFFNLGGYSENHELTENEINGIDDIRIPAGCTSFSYNYSYNDGTRPERLELEKILDSITLTLKKEDQSNYHFQFYCMAKDCMVYNLIDSFAHVDSFDSDKILIRNISNIDTDIEMMSFDYDFNKDYSTTQENYL